MADTLTIDVEKDAVLRAIDALLPAAERHTKAAGHVTALNIQREARARVARRTGRTAAGITVEESHDGRGWVVLPYSVELETDLITAGNDQQPANLPLWLEFGTKHMRARPYFFAAARLEEGAHFRRMLQAVQTAIDEQGLGE